MLSGIGQHRLEALAGHPLALAASLRLAARGAQASDELVTGLFQRGDVDETPGLRGGEGLALAGGACFRVSREAPLEPRDLVAKGAAGRSLIAALQGWRRNRAVVAEDRPRFQGLEIGRLGIAARVENPRQIAWVDAGVASGFGRSGREVLDSRHGGAGGHESALPLPRSDQALGLEAAIDGAGGVRVDAHSGRKLTDAGQPVSRGQPAAHDQRPQAPGEVDSDGKIVPPVQLHLP